MFGQLVWFLVVVSIALSITIENAHSLAGALLFLISPILFLSRFRARLQLDRTDKVLIAVLLGYFVFQVFFIAYDFWQVRELDKPSRFLIAVPMLLMLLAFKGRYSLLWLAVVVGSIGAFAIACYERFYLGIPRANNGMVAIMFGDSAMLLGLMSVVAGLYYFARRQWLWVCLAVVAVVAGIGASFLSGSRGGWVALPLVGSFLIWQAKDLTGKKMAAGVLVVALAAGVGVLSVPQIGVMPRVLQAVHNIEDYLQGNPSTSVGDRFEMWKASIYMFMDSPLLGVGESNAVAFKQGLADQGIISRSSVGYGHSHNEFFDFLSQKGIVGALVLLTVYLVPMRLFLQKMRQHGENWNIKAYAMAGALVPMSYIDFGLTQAMFSHNIGVVMYAFTIVYFWAAVRWAERDAGGRAS